MVILNDASVDYHANPLLGTSVMVSGYNSKTGLINLAKVKAYLDDMHIISAQKQKIFDLGSVQHAVVLEQDLSQVAVLPEFAVIPGKTVKEQKEEYLKGPFTVEQPKFKPIPGVTIKQQVEEFKEKNPAKYYIKESEFLAIERAFYVIAEHSAASRMISNALHVESSIYDPLQGIKCRPDIIGETDNGDLYICNYKTIHDLQKCDGHIYHLNYDIRAMQEIELVEKVLGRKVKHYFFLFQEKEAPYTLRCIEIGQIDWDIALEEYTKIRNTVLLAMRQNFFPFPEFTIETSKVYRSPQMETF